MSGLPVSDGEQTLNSSEPFASHCFVPDEITVDEFAQSREKIQKKAHGLVEDSKTVAPDFDGVQDRAR